ncbi:hypothetical protein HG1285_14564 [Hydrogenivirga sp. 128-5-R1-1]|nr:hypothetical protein HG1285_14564 [Hydrogenivirga sp. 128-5-R1-1]
MTKEKVIVITDLKSSFIMRR